MIFFRHGKYDLTLIKIVVINLKSLLQKGKLFTFTCQLALFLHLLRIFYFQTGIFSLTCLAKDVAEDILWTLAMPFYFKDLIATNMKGNFCIKGSFFTSFVQVISSLYLLRIFLFNYVISLIYYSTKCNNKEDSWDIKCSILLCWAYSGQKQVTSLL